MLVAGFNEPISARRCETFMYHGNKEDEVDVITKEDCAYAFVKGMLVCMFESDIELDIGIGDAPSLESGPINTLSISL